MNPDRNIVASTVKYAAALLEEEKRQIRHVVSLYMSRRCSFIISYDRNMFGSLAV